MSAAALASRRPALGALIDDRGLGVVERADVARSAAEALARQSAAGVYGHWVLAAVVLSTATFARAHPVGTAFAAAWVGLVGCGRLAVATSFASLWAYRPALWTRLFRGGLLLSSATWGFGGSVLLAATDFDHESRLVLLSVAGISAGAIASMAPDLALLRLHVATLLVPTLVIGVLFMPGTARLVAGFGTPSISWRSSTTSSTSPRSRPGR